MDNRKNLVLDRDKEKIEINMELWAEALLLAEDHGWVPIKPRTRYLAGKGIISDEEARAIHGGLDNLFEKALTNPIEVYPLRVDMGQLFLLKDFIEKGGFTIRQF